jgi:hypothetical protein
MEQQAETPALLEGRKGLRSLMKVIWFMVGLGILASLVALGAVIVTVMNMKEVDPTGPIGLMYVTLVVGVLGFAVSIFLSIFVAKNIEKGKNWARWIYLILAVWNLYNGSGSVAGGFAFSSVTAVLLMLLFLLGIGVQAYVCAKLFSAPIHLVFLKDKLEKMEKDLKDLRG